MNPRLIRLTTLALALLAPSASVAAPDKPAAERRRIVGILEVRVEGVPREIAAQFEANLEKHLDSHAYWLAPRARMHDMLANSAHWSDGCVMGPCIKEVHTQTGADIVLLAAITGSGTTFGYVVTIVRTDTGQVISQATDHCDVCTVNEALSSATSTAVKLVISVPDKLPDEAAERDAAITRLTAADASTLASEKRHHRHVAIAATLTGLAIAGAGSALYFAGSHRPYALATASSGGGLALGGLLSLAF